MDKIKNYKQFESTFDKIKFSELNNWRQKSKSNFTEASKIIVSRMETPILQWINDRGYTIEIKKGEPRGGALKYLGDGLPYTFYLKSSWTKEKFIHYLEEGDVDPEQWANTLGFDLDDLEIYGTPQSTSYLITRDGEGYGDLNVSMYNEDRYDDEEPWEDGVIKVELEYDDNGDTFGDYPLWGAKVPLTFNVQPKKNSKEYDVLCEFGLFFLKVEIAKFIKIGNYSGYDDFIKDNHIYDYNLGDNMEEVIEYMNLSNIHIKKNEDLPIAYGVLTNTLRQGSKLIEENHKQRKYKVPVSVVKDFLMNSPDIKMPVL